MQISAPEESDPMKILTNSILIAFLFQLFGCAPQSMTEGDLKKYVLSDKSGLHQSIEVNHVKMDVIFKPCDLLVIQELRGASVKNDSTVVVLRKKYKQQYYFILRTSSNGKEAVSAANLSQGDFSDVLQNVSFHMGEFVSITTTKADTILLTDFVYDRTFGMSSASDILIVFDKRKTEGSDWLQINLRDFGLGTGSQQFRFRKYDLDYAPKIDFSDTI